MVLNINIGCRSKRECNAEIITIFVTCVPIPELYNQYTPDCRSENVSFSFLQLPGFVAAFTVPADVVVADGIKIYDNREIKNIQCKRGVLDMSQYTRPTVAAV